jgi:hypothetical protein
VGEFESIAKEATIACAIIYCNQQMNNCIDIQFPDKNGIRYASQKPDAVS